MLQHSAWRAKPGFAANGKNRTSTEKVCLLSIERRPVLSQRVIPRSPRPSKAHGAPSHKFRRPRMPANTPAISQRAFCPALFHTASNDFRGLRTEKFDARSARRYNSPVGGAGINPFASPMQHYSTQIKRGRMSRPRMSTHMGRLAGTRLTKPGNVTAVLVL
jgi:hypothetical protein